MSRPVKTTKRTPVLTLRLDQELGAAFRRFCNQKEHRSRSRSAVLRQLLDQGLVIVETEAMDGETWRRSYDAARISFQHDAVTEATARHGKRRAWTRVEQRASSVVGLRLGVTDEGLALRLGEHADWRGITRPLAARDLLRCALGIVSTAAEAGELEGRAAAFEALKDAAVAVRRAE